MLRRMIHSSLKFPLLVAGLVVALFAGGYTQLRDMPVDALPDFAPVYVEVQTESLGLSAVEVEQSVLARWTIKPALMGVPGVANVAIWGQREQQMQVQVDPKLLAERGVTLSQVVTTSANALWVSPLSFVEASTPGTGGFIDTPNQRLGIQHILPITEPDHLASVALEGADGQPVLSGGKPVLLGDVVSVVEDHQPLIGDAVAGQSQGLVLVIEKFPEANAVEVSQGVENTLSQLAPGLSGVEFNTDLFRPASFIDLAITNLAWVSLIGLLLVVLVLALFHSWRMVVVGAVTLPLCLVAAALVLHLRGATMNLMLLAGLAVAVAVIIDDTVIDFDNVWRRLRARQRAGRRTTLVDAAHEMRRPMGFATLIMLAATVPVFYVGYRNGLDADIFLPAVLSYALALLASWVVTLTVAPVMCTLLLRGASAGRAGSPVARWVGRTYRRALDRGLARPAVGVAVVAVVAVLTVAGLVAVPFLDTDMRPRLQERALLIHWETAPGTSHPEMSRITTRVAEELRTLPGVRNVGAHVGRALTSDEVANVNSGEVWVSLAADADHDETMAAMQDVVTGYPGIEQEVLTYTDERVAAHGVGTRTPEDVVVRVFGQEYDVLAEKAEEVRNALAGVEDAGQVTVGTQPQEAQIEVQVDLTAAQRYNLTPGEVRRAAAVLVSGVEVGSLFEQQKVFSVMVMGTAATRHDLTLVQDLLIDAPDGRQVRLGDVADVAITPVPTVVRHNAVSRYVDVTATVTDGGVAAFTEETEEVLQGLDFPLEYHAEILGDYAEEQAAATQLLGFGVAALGAMFLLFQAYLRSWKLALVAAAGLPIALSGAMLVAALTGTGIDLGVLLGVLVIVGVYTRNLLALFAGYRSSHPQDDRRPDVAAVAQGAQDRVVPTITSALAVASALTPVVVLGVAPGLELIHSMAVVVLGGLVTSTLMTLFVVPLTYLHVVPDVDTTEVDTTETESRSTESEMEAVR